MMISRTRVIGLLVLGVSFLALCYAGYLFFGPGAKYRGLTTHIDVTMDDETRTYLENQLKTSQAALAAQKASGAEVDLNLYAAVSQYAYLLGDLVTARESVEAEIKGNPLNYSAVESYGSVLEKMGDFRGARTQYEKALTLANGGAPESFYMSEVSLLDTHFAQERDAVKSLLEQAVTEKGQTSWNMVELGRWYENSGDCDRAISHFEVAKTLAPKNQNIQDELQALREKCAGK